MDLKNELNRTKTLQTKLEKGITNINNTVVRGGGVQSTSIEELPNNIKRMIGNYNKIAMGETSFSINTASDKEGVINFSQVNFDVKRFFLIITEASRFYEPLDYVFGILDSSNLPNESNKKVAVLQFYPDYGNVKEYIYIRKATIDLKLKKMSVWGLTYPQSTTYNFSAQYIAIG